MQTFLAVTPEAETAAAAHTRALAHVAYRIGEGSTLLRRNLLLQSRGGLLSVSDREAPPIRDAGALCAAVLRECSRRGYGGAVLDFEEAPTQDRRAFVRQLAMELRRTRRALYLPEAYASEAPEGVILLCSSVSGGNFREYLQEKAAKRAPGRLALDAERLRMDFRLPCPSGEGRPLEEREFQRLMEQGPTVFFSPDLCARYFTYVQNGQTHFVLFDDAQTLNRKVRTAAELGFAAAFFMWPEVENIAGKIRW